MPSKVVGFGHIRTRLVELPGDDAAVVIVKCMSLQLYVSCEYAFSTLGVGLVCDDALCKFTLHCISCVMLELS